MWLLLSAWAALVGFDSASPSNQRGSQAETGSHVLGLRNVNARLMTQAVGSALDNSPITLPAGPSKEKYLLTPFAPHKPV